MSVEPSALSVPVNERDYELSVCPVSVSNPVYELSFCPDTVSEPIDYFFCVPCHGPWDFECTACVVCIVIQLSYSICEILYDMGCL